MSCLLLGLLLISGFSTVVVAGMSQNVRSDDKNDITKKNQENTDSDDLGELIASYLINGEQGFLKGWKFVGPAYVESEGKGLFIEKFRKKLIINTAMPTFFRIIRWWNYCNYYNPRAETTIKPIGGKEIHLTGPHKIIAGTLICPGTSIIGRFIIQKIEPKIGFIDKLFGEAIWDWGPTINFSKDKPILSILPSLFIPFMLMKVFRLLTNFFYMVFFPIPLYGFYKTLDFSGFSPFVLYKE